MKKLGGILLMVMVILAQVSPGSAQEENADSAAVVTYKEVSGQVSAINNKFIAIIYDKDEAKGVEYEMALPLDENVQLIHKQSIDKIKTGDTVSVRFQEKTTNNKGMQRIERKGVVIKFIRPKQKNF